MRSQAGLSSKTDAFARVEFDARSGNDFDFWSELAYLHVRRRYRRAMPRHFDGRELRFSEARSEEQDSGHVRLAAE